MREGWFSFYALWWSLLLHTVILGLFFGSTLLPGCDSTELLIPVDFTVVLEQNLLEPNVPTDTASAEEVSTPEPAEPAPPESLPEPIKEVVPLPEVKPPPKPPPPKPPPPKPVPTPTPPKPKPDKPSFTKGPRVKASQPSFDSLKPVRNKPVTDARLTRAEIERALQSGARVGDRNQIPQDEMGRCVLLIKRALYDAWLQPGHADAGTRPAQLVIRLDNNGRIVNYKIHVSSGSRVFDQSVLEAAARVAPIRGLSEGFLKIHKDLTVEFKLE